MAQVGDDCYFFCTSTCAKGPVCMFRHVEAAKTAKITCQHWQMGHCARPMCPFRHSTFEIPVMSKTEVPCYWESQPSGCKRPNCAYSHTKPRLGTVAAADEKSEGTSEEKLEPKPPENLSTPKVAPVVIPPTDSEESNTSPIKKQSETIKQPQPKAETATKLQTADAMKEISNTTIAGDEKDKLDAKEPEPMKKPKKMVQTQTGKTIAKTGGTGTKKIVKKVKPIGDSGDSAKKIVKKKIVKKAPASAKTLSEKSKKIDLPNRPKSAPTSQPLQTKKRLGSVPVKEKISKESSEDSDDSIENIKVMSMEEILRRKALESMMKKRAEEGKQLLPNTPPKKPSTITLKKSTANVKKTAIGPKKKTVQLNKPRSPVRSAVPIKSRLGVRKPPPPSRPVQHAVRKPPPRRPIQRVVSSEESESESESEEESEESPAEEEEEEQYEDVPLHPVTGKHSTSEASSESSSEDEDDSSDDSSSSDATERRVVIDVAGEEAARKRAKASMLMKQKQAKKAEKKLKAMGSPDQPKKKTASSKMLKKRRIINMDEDEDAPRTVKSRLKPAPISIQDRLGQPAHTESVLERAARLVVASDTGVSSAGEASPQKTHLVQRVRSLSEGEEEEDSRGLRMKSLEEIKEEKLKKNKPTNASERSGSLSPVKRTLNLSDDDDYDDNDETAKKEGRQILIVSEPDPNIEPGSPTKSNEEQEQKKPKRRPWRTQKIKVDRPSSPESKTVEKSKSPPPRVINKSVPEIEKPMAAPDVELSPFELLKRRTLERKIQQRQQALLERAAAVDREQAKTEAAEEDSEGNTGKSRKHKHKHKHKRSKGERQIYVPPGQKKSGLQRDEEEEESSELFDAGLGKKGKKGPHPIAAAWTAGLSLSGKGLGVRRAEALASTAAAVSEKPSTTSSLSQRLSKPIGISQSLTKQAESSEANSGPVAIKSFSEIMAEKKRRRLEMMAQKSGGSGATTVTGAVPLSASSKSSPIRSADSKPRVPITPIIFDKGTAEDKESLFTFDGSLSSNTSSTAPLGSLTTSQTTSASSASPGGPLHSRLKREAAPSTQQQPTEVPKKSKKLFKKRKSHDKGLAADVVPPAKSPPAPPPPPEAPSIPEPDFEFDEELDLMPYEDLEESTSVTEPPVDTKPPVVTKRPVPLPVVAPKSPELSVALEKSSVEESRTSPKPFHEASIVTPSTSSSALTRKSVTPEDEVPPKKSRLSLDDEFGLDDVDDAVITAPDESIDDLLADIDDLLA